ncbi:hypothetical protein BMW23_0826 [Bodo saltans virus]|uniref:Uncharacterized protein n=1 Tax=Bodo saltans virus TaxID=2024608 RepID=A0A2H4UVC4_9VIRU|nr:hypothetical protein QJ851_gp0809 [Bodo saltans virus]ATZ80872.1 hypothetical protein BMW23_0826 [Bodo saltans virus]
MDNTPPSPSPSLTISRQSSQYFKYLYNDFSNFLLI